MMALFAVFEKAEDPVLREKLRKRIARLAGAARPPCGSAVTMRDASRNARSWRSVRPACCVRHSCTASCRVAGPHFWGRPLVLQRRMAQSADADERAAYRILLTRSNGRCVSSPHNAGFDTEVVMAQVALAGPGYGLDATTGKVVR